MVDRADILQAGCLKGKPRQFVIKVIGFQRPLDRLKAFRTFGMMTGLVIQKTGIVNKADSHREIAPRGTQ
jgi:hypothetical protein